MIKSNYRMFMLAAVFAAGTLFSCSEENEGQGKISLSITDAPTDADDISGVYITITGVEYRMEEESWTSFETFSGPVTLNLLELTEGTTALLGDFDVEAGTYTGLRFKLDASANGGSVNNAATYLEFTDGRQEPLYVPSGTQSGYKAKGTFTVPVNGSVFITADFDVRKSVVKAGSSGKYLLKPTIRLVVNDQAGTISGATEITENAQNYVVFAYEEGTWTEEEAAEPAEGEARFPNAVTSGKLREDGTFVLPFLAPGSYQLVIASFEDGEFRQIEDIHEELVVVQSQEETTVEITF